MKRVNIEKPTRVGLFEYFVMPMREDLLEKTRDGVYIPVERHSWSANTEPITTLHHEKN